MYTFNGKTSLLNSRPLAESCLSTAVLEDTFYANYGGNSLDGSFVLQNGKKDIDSILNELEIYLSVAVPPYHYLTCHLTPSLRYDTHVLQFICFFIAVCLWSPSWSGYISCV